MEQNGRYEPNLCNGCYVSEPETIFVRNQLPLHSLQKGPLRPHRLSHLARYIRLNWKHDILKGSA